MKTGIGAVVPRQPAQAAQQLGDVAAEHAAERVQLVDDDVAQPAEERGPPLVVGQQPGVEHLGVGEHDRGVLADPGALLGAGVAVVGAGDHAGQLEGGERAQLVVGQRLGGEQDQRRARADRGAGRLGDRHLVAERLARRRARGDHDRAAGAGQVDGLGLVRPQRPGQPVGHGAGQRPAELGVPGGARRSVGEVDQPARAEVGAHAGVGVVGPVALEARSPSTSAMVAPA